MMFIPHSPDPIHAPYDHARMQDIQLQKGIRLDPATIQEGAARMLRKSQSRLTDGDIATYFLAMRKYSIGGPAEFSMDNDSVQVIPPDLLEPARHERAQYDAEEYEAVMDLLDAYLLERKLIPFSRKLMHIRSFASWPHPLRTDELSPLESALVAIDGEPHKQICTFGLDPVNGSHDLVYVERWLPDAHRGLVPQEFKREDLSKVKDYRFLGPWPSRL